MVYVLNMYGDPLMPCKEAKARKLLQNNKAKIIKYEPFTIQLLFECENNIQDVVLGVDPGTRFIGLSASTKNLELFSAEVILRNDIVNLISTRSQNRRSRRSRLRYRKPRFLNRTKSKKRGWIAPSIQNKINIHLKAINNIFKVLPVSKIIIEIANFDIQKIKNCIINNFEFSDEQKMSFWNVRQYVLWRDKYKCQGKNNCNNKILNVHHIESKKTGGDSPNNLITLCKDCHKNYHKGILKLNLTRGKSLRDISYMEIMKQNLYKNLSSLYNDVYITYGYITKNCRIQNNFLKTHRADALCIAGNPNAKRLNFYYYIKQVRRHNRQIHKSNILIGGKKKLNQAHYFVRGFRLFDKVKYNNKKCFIFGRRSSGYFDLRLLDGTVVDKSANYKKLKLLCKRSGFLMDKMTI